MLMMVAPQIVILRHSALRMIGGESCPLKSTLAEARSAIGSDWVAISQNGVEI
jgi:hypothetical protein